MSDSVLNEEVFLPSLGLIYPKEYNIPKSLTVCPFKTRDFKGLFGSNSSSAINSLIKNCIVGNLNIDVKNLHVQDRTALFTRIRAITLGSTYKTKRECSYCKKMFDIEWDLNNIECTFLDVESYPILVELPNSKKEIYVGVPLPKDIEEAEEIVSKKKQNNKDLDTDAEMLFYYTASTIKIIDGVYPALQSKAEFLADCHPEDYGFLQSIDSALTFGIKTDKEVSCPFCDSVYTVQFSPMEQFFRSAHGLPTGIKLQKGILGCNPTKTV